MGIDSQVSFLHEQLRSLLQLDTGGHFTESLTDQIASSQGALTAGQLSELLSIPAVTIFKMAKSGRVPYLFVSVAVCDFVHAQSPTGSEIAVAKSLSINSYKHVCG